VSMPAPDRVEPANNHGILPRARLAPLLPGARPMTFAQNWREGRRRPLVPRACLAVLIVFVFLTSSPGASFVGGPSSPGPHAASTGSSPSDPASPSVAPVLPRGSGLVSAGSTNSEWVNVTAGIPNGPPPRSNASAIYDPNGSFLLLFGGQIGPTPLNDTWTFANGVWTQLYTRNSPVARFGAGITYDQVHGYVVLFGGATSPGPTGVIQVNVTWDFYGRNWHHLGTTTPPRGRSFPSFAYDPNLNASVLFGGLLPTNQSAETWELDYVDKNWTWTPITAGGPGQPLARVAGSMTFDNSTRQLIMFGGWDPETATPLLLNDTWVYNESASDPNASTWTAEITPPNLSPRSDAAIAFNPTLDAVVLFGGLGANGPLNDTWLWNGSTWNPASAPGPSPNPRSGDVLSECPTPGGNETSPALASILLGGTLAPGVLALDVWFYGDLPLSVLPPTVTPRASDVGHPGTLSVFAFGGSSRTYTYTWLQLPPGCVSQNLPEFTCTPTSSSNAPYPVNVSVRNGSGVTVFSPSAAWSVNPPPSVTLFTVLPSPLPAKTELTISVLYSGGTVPLAFLYTGLPAGCSSIDSAQFNCTPSTPGNYSIQVKITDADGESDTGSTSLVVGDPVGTGSALWEYVLEGIVISAVAVVLIEVVRRKLRPPARGRGRGAPGSPASKYSNGVKPWDESKAPAPVQPAYDEGQPK
jgi:hypothetical protein